MPHFDIVKRNQPSASFRVEKIKADFDVRPENSWEHFTGDISLPDKWQIGVIVGGSGTGKTTIAREVFPEAYCEDYVYAAASVIDDMPPVPVDEIEKTFYAVGFGSVPSWLKPYAVLSNGEKMRVNLARAFLERDFFVFDEFTSVVDRTVAQTACIAMQKAIRKTTKKFVAISCHYDILDWLQPDWVFDTNEMRCFFPDAHDLQKNISCADAIVASGQNLSVIII